LNNAVVKKNLQNMLGLLNNMKYNGIM